MIPQNELQVAEQVLGVTESLCPVCLSRIEARYVLRGEEIWFVKQCAAHGPYDTKVWQGAASFAEWSRPNPSQSPTNPAHRVERGCPYDCGLCDAHKQATCCVLLEVTQRCNLHCPVCFASAGEGESADPSMETIHGWYDMLLNRGGPFNIQLSGGEPTLRDDLPEIIRLGREKGFSFFQLNTNGLRIAREPAYLHALAEAGLNTVFLQFDTLCADAAIRLRGRDVVGEKIQAIENCAREHMGLVLVPTILRGCNESEAWPILEFAAARMPTVRGVHFQPLSYFGRCGETPNSQSRILIPELLSFIERQSGGRLKAGDFLPGGAEHPLCSFHGDYEIHEGVWEAKSPKASCCCGSPQTSDITREAVAGKWAIPPPPPPMNLGEEYQFAALDDFLQRKAVHTLAISGMAFQDAWTIDLQRLERCYIHIVSAKGELVPFCAYNMTSVDGKALYRKA